MPAHWACFVEVKKAKIDKGAHLSTFTSRINNHLSLGRDSDTGFLPETLALVEARWPRVADAISFAEEPTDIAWIDNTPEPTLMVEGIHLSSGYAQKEEAWLQASLIPEDSERACIYGIGVGALQRVLLRRKNLKRLTVTLLNPAVARATFKYFDQRDWLSDPRVELLLGSDSDLCIPFAAVPSCLQLADESSARLRDLVFLELSTPI